MSFQVPVHFVQQYSTNVAMLLQQKGGKLLSAVTRGSYTGKAAKSVEQVGKVKPVKNLSRHADTPIISTPGAARWVFPNDYDWADLIDDQDKLRMLIDPTSAYAMNAREAMARAQDDEILQAFFADARTGENGTTSTPFGTAMDVGVNTGGTASNLNVAKLRAAKKLKMAGGVDIDSDPLYGILSSADHDAMLNEAQAVSLDYNTRPVLVDGKISSFMGYNFIHVEVTSPEYDAQATIGGSTRQLPFWARSGMHLGEWNSVQTKVSERNDKRHATQIYVTGTFGATRLEEGRVARIYTTGA